MARKLNRNKPFDTVHGDLDGAAFEQDGHLFDIEGKEVGLPSQEPEAEPEVKQEPDAEQEAAPAEANKGGKKRGGRGNAQADAEGKADQEAGATPDFGGEGAGDQVSAALKD